MQEDKRVARRGARTGIHLQRTAAWRGQHLVAARGGKLDRVVRAAAIDDDDFVAARTQRRQGRERLADARGLVQHRHDDAQPRRHACSRSRPASTFFGACARRQAPAAYLFASTSVG